MIFLKDFSYLNAFPQRLALYLKDVELSKATFKGFSALLTGD